MSVEYLRGIASRLRIRTRDLALGGCVFFRCFRVLAGRSKWAIAMSWQMAYCMPANFISSLCYSLVCSACFRVILFFFSVAILSCTCTKAMIICIFMANSDSDGISFGVFDNAVSAISCRTHRIYAR